MMNIIEDFPKIRVLVIEDDIVAAIMAKLILVGKGCIVDISLTDVLVIKSLDEAYHMILLDLGLPDLNGFEVDKIIRDSRLTIPIAC